MTISVMILLVLMCQIWFLSYFYPKQVIRRIDYVLTHCPESEYPKLYPISVDRINTIKLVFKYLNHFFALIGIFLLSYFLFIVPDYREHLNILDDLPLLYGMSQFIPLFILEVLGFKHLKLMRQQNTQTSRKADLQPRRLFDFIHPIHLLLAVFTYIGFVLFELFISNFSINLDVGIKIGTITLVNIMFIVLGMANLYGKRRDPYIENVERNKQTKFVLQSLLFTSIFVSIYLMLHSWVNINELNYLEVLINSLYFQVLALFSIGALLGRFKIEEMNFDAYKVSKST
ncbi:MAG: hypothetical protein KC484_12970 [Colwelliaceae bacterium]|nr:hypothetical protein [Colwelliaceae bacterium]